MAQSALPKWTDYFRTGFEKGLHVFAKGRWHFAFDINRAQHLLALSVEHWNNYL
jgi:hypothetical protein